MISFSRSTNPPLHVEIQTHRKNPIGLIRSSFWVDGKTRHQTFARITGKTLQQLKAIQAAFRGKALPGDDPRALRTGESREYGGSAALFRLAADIGLERVLYSRKEPWVRCALAMIIGRILFQGSKLSLVHHSSNSSLWSLAGLNENELDVEHHCYLPMDRLLQRQVSIQEALVKKHLQDGSIILYDITSSYFEGEYSESEIVSFGYNRDKKRGCKQIVIGLVCNVQGCPVCVEVFAGNTKDESTVEEKIQQLQSSYGIKRMVFVGDRGMLTQANQEKLKGNGDLDMISSLTHPQILELIKDKTIEPELFDESKIIEIADPNTPDKWLYLCRNPNTAQREKSTRKSLMQALGDRLDKIAQGAKKKSANAEQIAVRLGRAFEKYSLGKFVKWEIIDVKVGKQARAGKGLSWSWDENKIASESLIDGCYVISSTAPKGEMSAEETVQTYKGLSMVEQAFRNFKTASLQMRPICHKTDDRIRAHVFICMLAYYLQWHMNQRLKPLYEQDGKHEQRQWTLAHVLETLMSIRSMKAQLNGIEFEHVDTPTPQQQRILDLLEARR